MSCPFSFAHFRDQIVPRGFDRLECPQRYKHTSTMVAAQSEAEVPEGKENNAAHRVYWQAALCIKLGLKYPQHLPVSERDASTRDPKCGRSVGDERPRPEFDGIAGLTPRVAGRMIFGNRQACWLGSAVTRLRSTPRLGLCVSRRRKSCPAGEVESLPGPALVALPHETLAARFRMRSRRDRRYSACPQD